MLPLKKQVCSLELSKKLKELEVQQESEFYWYCDEERDDVDVLNWTDLNRTDGGAGYWTHKYSAFTVAELGEMLPSGMQSNKIDQPTDKPKVRKNEWHSWAWNFKPSFFGETEAESRAKMLIYLLENDLMGLTN
jgi:hypothetical protein